jgi:hypothetical protein
MCWVGSWAFKPVEWKSKRPAKSNDCQINTKGTEGAYIPSLGIGNGNSKSCLLFKFHGHLIERSDGIQIRIRTLLSIV